MSAAPFPRVVGYLRVSTAAQSLEAQTGPIVSYCERSGLQRGRDFELYEEVMSGAGKARPVLEAIVQACRNRKIKVVVVWKLDRLGRSSQHLSYIISELTRAGTDLISLTDGIDTRTSNPTSQLQIGILSAFAEYERGMIRERSMAGQEAARLAGRLPGRPGIAEATRQRILAYAKQLKKNGGNLSMSGIGELCSVSRMTVARVIEEESKK